MRLFVACDEKRDDSAAYRATAIVRSVFANAARVGVGTVVVSTQHSEMVSNEELHASIIKHVIETSIPAELLAGDVTYHINPTGRFVVGGPQGDAGLTGRKIIVDTYGGAARHGGGAFSGKDPSKVDRIGRLRGSLGGEERRRRRIREALRGAARVCDRRRRAGERDGRHLRHVPRARGSASVTRSARCSISAREVSSERSDFARRSIAARHRAAISAARP